ncbi:MULTISPECIES: hypothetical protein [Streptomyces]|uniref:Transmembrane protein n=1 Tax=Streptomyces qinglanensis TaxID=943816 RepID=A0A1E7K3Q6_9ACTN|nr:MULTISPECIES: hypothetical protein [Streptomyces]OEU98549.1 hypothetical protein AN217_12815 [Streptomyces qinglanensis]OEV26777.1 hypothetical protein AN220_07190 [Streptomyces nanshensis]
MSGETETFEEAMDEVRLWSRFLAGLALAAVVTVTMMLCVPLKEEGAGAHSPSCGPTIAPEDPRLHTVECNTRHIRQIGYAGLLLAAGLGCGVVSFLLRIERRPPRPDGGAAQAD